MWHLVALLLLCVAFAFALLCFALLCFALLCSALLSSALLQQSGAKQSNVTCDTLLLCFYFAFTLLFALILLCFALLCFCFALLLLCFALLCFALTFAAADYLWPARWMPKYYQILTMANSTYAMFYVFNHCKPFIFQQITLWFFDEHRTCQIPWL